MSSKFIRTIICLLITATNPITTGVTLAQNSNGGQSLETAEPLMEIPLKDGEIFYESIVAVDSNVKKETLFTRAKSFLINHKYTHRNLFIIELEAKEQGKLQGLCYIDMADGRQRVACRYDITVKDGRYRLQLYDFKRFEVGGYSKGANWMGFISMQEVYNRYRKSDGKKKSYRNNVADFIEGVEALQRNLKDELAKPASTDEF